MQPGHGSIELFLRLRRAGDDEVYAAEFRRVVAVIAVLSLTIEDDDGGRYREKESAFQHHG
jgi:hypothetical protein